jgi:signal transduction histidine kinase/CheY-like chemotaxis protein
MLSDIRKEFLDNKHQFLIISKNNIVKASDNVIFDVAEGSDITDFHPFFFTLSTLFDEDENSRHFFCVQIDILGKTKFLDIRSKKNTEKDEIFLHVEDMTEHYKNVHQIKQVRNESIIQFNIVQELNNQLEVQRGFKNKFLANVSHEIRTPLNSIKGFVNVLKMSNISKEQLDLVNIIEDSSETLVTILDDLLDISKIEAGRLEIKNRRFDFESLMNVLSKTYSLRAEEKRLDFIFEIGENIPRFLVGDRLRINQVLINLLENAIRYTHKGSIKLQIGTSSRNLRRLPITFEIIDTGIGIAPENIDKIFESFTQLEKRGLFGGSGLGLSIVKQLTDLMESELEVTSLEGEGSSFKFTITLGVSHDQRSKTNEVSAPLVALPAQKVKGKKKRILYGEDIEVNQLLMTKFFAEQGGYSLDIAKNGEWVIEYLERYPYDLLLLDLTMPVMDGYDAATAIRSHSDKKIQKIPIIALTARTTDEERMEAKEVGINAYITKPVDPDILFETVEKLLTKYKKKVKE